jgi:hypothetical protein
VKSGKVEILEYRSVLSYNRETFLIKYPFAVADFERIDRNFSDIAQPLHSGRDRHEHSHAGLLPSFLLMQRQCRSAFQSLSSFQSYEAWLLLRPAIESALICGKWIDDPKNARIWADRRAKPKPYRKEYRGTALQSRSLPLSREIQAVLAKINDDFVHPNPEYYQRHLSLQPLDDRYVGVTLGYFDDEPQAEASVYSLFLLILTVQGALRDMLGSYFPTLNSLDLGHGPFAAEYEPRVTALAKTHPSVHDTLKNLGLWGLRPAA